MQLLLTVVVLLVTGALIGSFLLEWRHTPLEVPPGPDAFRGTPLLPENAEARVRVEVLNGAGTRGAAERVASRLRAMGFDVVYFGNADRFDVSVTHVLDRSGRPVAAGALADSLGIGHFSVDLDPELHLDATVVLGSDWEALLAPQGPPPEDERRRPGGS